MKRRGSLLIAVAVVGLGLGLLCSGSAYAVTSELISDFDVTNFDEQVSVLNPQGSNGCALIYIFDHAQTLQECCGCLLFGNGLLDLSVEDELCTLPSSPERGIIEAFPSQPNAAGTCDPTKTPVGTATILQAAEYQPIPSRLLKNGAE